MTRGKIQRGLDLVVRPSRAEAALWRRLRFEGEAGCRLKLFDRYVWLARALAGRYFGRQRRASLERSDCEHLAYEGLLQAIDRYDPLRRVPFRAFAGRRILGGMSDGAARMSEVAAQLSLRRRIERERLRSLARSDEAVGENAIDALAELATGLAIGLILEENGREPVDPAPSAYESLEWRELQKRLAHEMERLDAREALILHQHYEVGLTFAQISALLELSRGRVSQLHRGALLKLRRRLGASA